jgi:hypothetical protein
MSDATWKPIGAEFCEQYQCEAQFCVDEAHSSGPRHLIVRYDEGYSGRTDLPIVNGSPQFAAAIPDDWSEQDVMDLIRRPMKSPGAPLPSMGSPFASARQHDLVPVVGGQKAAVSDAAGELELALFMAGKLRP